MERGFSPTPHMFWTYKYFAQQYGWTPEVVDKQDAKIMRMFIIEAEHRKKIKEAKENV